MPKGGGRTKPREVVFDDGVAYRLGWEPLYQFTLEAGAPAASTAASESGVAAGEGVLFPPGWIHETFNTADTCTSLGPPASIARRLTAAGCRRPDHPTELPDSSGVLPGVLLQDSARRRLRALLASDRALLTLVS